MNLNSDLPFWTVQSGLVCIYPPLEEDVQCEALVVGGGISGALVAYQLSLHGVDCVVIDGRDIGHGSTSASTALLQYEIDTPLYKLRSLVGIGAANRAYKMGVEAIQNLRTLAGNDCTFKLRPSLQVATSQAAVTALRREYATRREIGLSVHFLEKTDLQESNINAAAGLRSTVAAEMNPYLFTHRLLRLSAKRGVRVFDRTAALRYRYSKRGVTVATSRGTTIKCKAVFFATGYETKEFFPKKIISLKSTYAFVSEPVKNLAAWKDRSLIWTTGDPYLYMRTTSDNRVLVGGEDDSILEAKRRDSQLQAKTKILLRKFQSMYPGICLEPAFSWAGVFGGTKDGLGYIGRHPAFPNAYFALGFGGNGITYSEIASRLLVDLFLDRRVGADHKIFSFDR